MEDLIQRARQGDSQAFAELFERCKQPMWRAAMAVLENGDDAADALQEAAIKAWRAMPRFGGRSSVDTWLMRILLRTCFDARRRRSREMPFDLTMTGAALHEGAPLEGSALGDAGVLMGRQQSCDHDEALDVREALRRLPDADRLVLALFYTNDFPARQIAAILNVSEGAVRTRLVRARERFKVLYCGNERESKDNRESEVAR